MAVTLISFRAGEVVEALRAAGQTLTGTSVDTRGAIEKLIQLAEMSRKEGVHTLERRMKEFRSNPFLTRALSLVIDGAAPEDIERLLDAERAAAQDRAAKSSCGAEAGSRNRSCNGAHWHAGGPRSDAVGP